VKSTKTTKWYQKPLWWGKPRYIDIDEDGAFAIIYRVDEKRKKILMEGLLTPHGQVKVEGWEVIREAFGNEFNARKAE